jgi:hypothetical protein
MEVVGLGFYFEDLPLGRRFRTIGRTVTEADITNFVNCTGMVEVLFANTEFLREVRAGNLGTPGVQPFQRFPEVPSIGYGGVFHLDSPCWVALPSFRDLAREIGQHGFPPRNCDT